MKRKNLTICFMFFITVFLPLCTWARVDNVRVEFTEKVRGQFYNKDSLEVVDRLGTSVSCKFDGLEIKDALSSLATEAQLGLSIDGRALAEKIDVYAPDPSTLPTKGEQKVTLKIENLPAREALSTMLKPLGLIYEVKAHGIRITSSIQNTKDRWNLDANRHLESAEQLEMANLINLMLDKQRDVDSRWHAAKALGERIAHSHAMRYLEAALNNTDDEFHIRYWALTSLSQIQDKRIVPILIKFLGDGDQTIRFRAAEQLRKLSGESFGFDSDAPEESRTAATAKWKQWWDANEDTFKVDRSKALMER